MKTKNIQTYCYYAVVVVLAVGFYYLLDNLSDGIVKALLDFYKTVVEIFFNNSHYYVEEYGWYQAGAAYTIGRECLGLGVVALIFGCCGVLSVKTFRGYWRVIAIVISAPVAFISGVFANVLRLLSSIYFIVFTRFELIHALLGIVIYLSVLFMYYRAYVWLNNRLPTEEANLEVNENSLLAGTENSLVEDSLVNEDDLPERTVNIVFTEDKIPGRAVNSTITEDISLEDEDIEQNI